MLPERRQTRLRRVLAALALSLLPSCQEVRQANADTHRALVTLREELGVDCTLRWHSDSKMSPDVFEVDARCSPHSAPGRPEDLIPKVREILERSFHRKMSRCTIVIEDSSAPG